MERYQNYYVLYCVPRLCTAMSTLMTLDRANAKGYSDCLSVCPFVTLVSHA